VEIAVKFKRVTNRLRCHQHNIYEKVPCEEEKRRKFLSKHCESSLLSLLFFKEIDFVKLLRPRPWSGVSERDCGEIVVEGGGECEE
jgi:hypothetical protein